MFSKSCEYAIKIMIFIASKSNGEGRIGLDEIAEAIGSPKAFTAKILQQLSKAKLLDSLRGRSGGFYLNKSKSINLADIVKAIDGDRLMHKCVVGFKVCSEAHPCPVHNRFKGMREHLNLTLSTTTLDELKDLIDNELAFLLSK